MESATLPEECSDLTESEYNLLVEGPLWKAIASMSLPLMLNGLSISAATLADAFVAGKLGSAELAAVGLGGQIWFGMIIMAIAIATGANALVSRFWGARDFAQSQEAARQSIFSAFIFGLVSAFIGVFSTGYLLRLLGADEKVQELGTTYLRVQFLAQLPLTVLWVCHAVFRGRGNAGLPTAIMALVTIGVVALDFLLCLYPLHLGIVGIGFAWLIATTVGCVLMLLALRYSELAPALAINKERPFNFSWSWFWRIMRIGLPACFQDLAWVCSNFGLFLIFSLAAHPVSYQAAWAVGLRVEDVVAGMPMFAMSMGVSTVVGQNLGAKNLDRARKAGWLAAAYGATLMCLLGIGMFVFAEPVANIMTTDPAVAQYSKEYLQIIGLSEPAAAIWFILFGAMEGAGYTRVPMLLSFGFLLAVRLPLAFVFIMLLGLGPSGGWLAIALTSVVGAVVAAVCYKKGIWQYHKI